MSIVYSSISLLSTLCTVVFHPYQQYQHPLKVRHFNLHFTSLISIKPIANSNNNYFHSVKAKQKRQTRSLLILITVIVSKVFNPHYLIMRNLFNISSYLFICLFGLFRPRLLRSKSNSMIFLCRRINPFIRK